MNEPLEVTVKLKIRGDEDDVEAVMAQIEFELESFEVSTKVMNYKIESKEGT